MNRHPRFRIALGLVAVGAVVIAGFTATQRATGAAPDQDGDLIPDAVECPVLTSSALVNGGFEDPLVAQGSVVFVDQAVVPGWDSTDNRGRIQLWASALGTSPFDGRQDAELNTDRVADLFQDVATTPGETMAWSLQHHGRSGSDTMRVRIGAPGTVGLAAGPDLVADQTAWVPAAGRITVPAGQTTSRFFLESVAHTGGPAEGNFVDSVVFAPVDRDTDLDGIADCADTDSDNDGLLDSVEAGPDPTHPIDSDANGIPDYRQPAAPPTVDAVDDIATVDDAATISLDVSTNDDVPTDAVYSVVRPPAHGIASISAGGTLELSGAPDYGGPDTVGYRVCAATTCDTAVVGVTVDLVNDTPVLADDQLDDSIAHGIIYAIDVLANDRDPDGPLDPATLRITSSPTVGAAVVIAGKVAYTMPQEAGPSTTFTYEVCDTGSPVRCAQAQVRVGPAPDPPDPKSVDLP